MFRTSFPRSVTERLESRLLLSSTVASIDGTGNNAANPDWGSAAADLIRRRRRR